MSTATPTRITPHAPHVVDQFTADGCLYLVLHQPDHARPMVLQFSREEALDWLDELNNFVRVTPFRRPVSCLGVEDAHLGDPVSVPAFEDEGGA
ncbi:hypothetical protein [Corynebacterium pseudopelargi]|uniref:Uncharacterized protein n=1 Tax=Corynebacterium pseudopelargi TaxID=2080757 RepID=A0A3G6ISM6_9CORY|nr:hypothetical protein [Corynebacterium pseudopelargi]AZA08507.1 hypothetical protein CPPEL_01805 [Corynebacterium pseudopelargi]